MERNWKFTDGNNLAYDTQDLNLVITGQICTDRDGVPWVAMDEEDSSSYFTYFSLSPNGTLRFKSWGELTQFNHTRNLLSQIRFLNQFVSNKFNVPMATLSVKIALNQESPFKVENTVLDADALLNLEADLVMVHGTFHLEKQFCKYTNISEALCNHTWTIPELFNFAVHLQKFLYLMESKAVKSSQTLFLDVDQEVIEEIQ